MKQAVWASTTWLIGCVTCRPVDAKNVVTVVLSAHGTCIASGATRYGRGKAKSRRGRYRHRGRFAPSLKNFYASFNDDQKAKFNILGPRENWRPLCSARSGFRCKADIRGPTARTTSSLAPLEAPRAGAWPAVSYRRAAVRRCRHQ
jgi:hypothetical protein